MKQSFQPSLFGAPVPLPKKKIECVEFHDHIPKVKKFLPPPRSPVKKIIPQPKRKRLAFRPDLIDSTLFEVDPIRPYPEWPLICKATGLLAFKDAKEAQNWSKSIVENFFSDSWQCSACNMIHAKYKVRGPSGYSSGNAREAWPSDAYDKFKSQYAVT